MTPLRAYLMVRAGDGQWNVSVYRDLDAILNAWTDLPQDSRTGVLHVGFDRPASQQFDEVASAHKGRMLLTGAAKHSLPLGFDSSREPVGEVDGIPVFLGLRGWGYILADQEKVSGPQDSPLPEVEPEGWLKEFFSSHFDAAVAIRSAGIYSEETYLANESKLKNGLRHQIGLARFRSIVRTNSEDPCEIVRASPPWLLDRPFERVNLSVRVANAFVASNLTRVKDLLIFDTNGLLKIPNFGRKSVRDLHGSLLEALSEGPEENLIVDEQVSCDPLLVELNRALTAIEERGRDILCRRMGLGKTKQTLQEIGDEYGITRERIRQIESKSLDQIRKPKTRWPDLIIAKLEGLLLGRDFPMPVLGLEAADNWFEGLGKTPSTFKYILSNVCDDQFSIVSISGIEYVGRVLQETWNDFVREARRLLATGAEESWSEVHCRTMVEGLLDESKREFRSLLWQQASFLCHFIEESDGKRKLAAYGRGAEQVVEAILLDSREPLHFSEIARLSTERVGKEIEIRRAHAAAASIGILLGRGIYGLEHHIKVPDDKKEILRDELEQIILSGPDDRQWHSSELLSIAAERHLVDDDVLDKYVIDHILSTSPILQQLGRMVWSKGISTHAARIDVRQAVISLLQRAGQPLSTNELRQRLVALRGVSSNFQIISSDMVVRLRAGFWGLNDRDIPLKRTNQSAFIDRLVQEIAQKGSGVHISEIKEFVGDWLECAEEITPEALFSLGSCDDRLQISPSEYLFLKDWKDARRITLAEAVGHVLNAGSRALSTAAIVAAVEEQMHRAASKRDVILCLHANDVHQDLATKLWSKRAVTEDEIVPDNFVPSSSLMAPINWAP